MRARQFRFLGRPASRTTVDALAWLLLVRQALAWEGVIKTGFHGGIGAGAATSVRCWRIEGHATAMPASLGSRVQQEPGPVGVAVCW